MLLSRCLAVLLMCHVGLFGPVRADAEGSTQIRFATYNIAMGLAQAGELHERLKSGDDEGLRLIAAVIQNVRPDVLLLNEFDYLQHSDSAALFRDNYLAISQSGQAPIVYNYSLDGPVNTGVDSGLDLNNNGITGEAEDAWGFGRFPYQYGMLVLSRLPLQSLRHFRLFKWRDMPDALEPRDTDGSPWYPAEVWQQLRLSSKNHWDIALVSGKQSIHFLASHPTPPVFDGPEDRNGARNHDEIRFWADYVEPGKSGYIYDQAGNTGGLEAGEMFIIAGDLNADPADGDSHPGAINQLLRHPLINSGCVPASTGALEASTAQAGKNLRHQGNPAFDSADFNDKFTGNMRIDYVLPSTTLSVTACGVFWPASGQPGHEWIDASDHRLVWVDIELDG